MCRPDTYALTVTCGTKMWRNTGGTARSFNCEKVEHSLDVWMCAEVVP